MDHQHQFLTKLFLKISWKLYGRPLIDFTQKMAHIQATVPLNLSENALKIINSLKIITKNFHNGPFFQKIDRIFPLLSTEF
jgi:hypothetical protein